MDGPVSSAERGRVGLAGGFDGCAKNVGNDLQSEGEERCGEKERMKKKKEQTEEEKNDRARERERERVCVCVCVTRKEGRKEKRM